MAPFKALAGRCFLYSSRQGKKTRYIGYVRYGKEFKFSPGRAEVGTHDSVSFKKDTVHASIHDEHAYAGTGLVRKTSTGENAYSIFNETRRHVREVTLEEFKHAWDIARNLSIALVDDWEKSANIVDPPVGVDMSNGYRNAIRERCPDVFEIDLLHVVLEGMEASIISGSPFFLTPSCYLVSPNSLAYARQAIADRESTDARCSHLYAACDMRHVDGTRQAIASLRAKLKL